MPMSFSITHRYGAMDRNPPFSALDDLLAEIENGSEDPEHGSVALTHESEWCLSVAKGGYVIFENLEHGRERHMRGVPRAKTIQLWKLLAMGDIAAVESEPWRPGYG
jgi:hypothetical protein